MTIKKRLYISFSLILSIIIFIIGIFFYTIYNLNKVHSAQSNRYDQILRVEKLKEYNNSFSWIVLDIIIDFDKVDVVKDRLNKADKLFSNLYLQKKQIIGSAESIEEKNNLEQIFNYFKNIERLIKDDLFTLVLSKNEQQFFDNFNVRFEKISKQTNILLVQEMNFLKDKLQQTEKKRYNFIDTIKLELVITLFIAFIISFIISSKIIKKIKDILQKLNKGVLQLFSNDENTIKVDLSEKNELSEITENLNSYLEKQRYIIHSREELLRNISHELKTPITKGKFLLENLKSKNNSTELMDINSVFIDIEELTSKLLEREKLNFATLNQTKFKVSSLILDALSKLSIDDESKIILDIDNDFDIQADKYYLTLALKNLIDNALKYAKEYPITIYSSKRSIYIANISQKLSNDLIYYIQPFTREANQQVGHGLGLNIVNKVITMHNFKFEYKYEDGKNIFFITF